MFKENQHLLILDGHNLLVTIDVVRQAHEIGLDLITSPSHASHGVQPLDVSCFERFENAFRRCRDVWSLVNKRRGSRKEDSAHWVSMSLHRTLTTENIMACCKTCRIWPFDDTNMNSKMRPSENYACNYAHESLESINVRVKEIEEETLLLRFPEERLSTSHCFVELDGEGEEEGGDTSPPWHSTHVWVHDGDEDIIPSTQCKNLDVNPPIGVLSISRFLALPNHKEVTPLLLKPTCKQKKKLFFPSCITKMG